jgi:dihydrofolate reductase
MARFKALTMGKIVIVGRKTWESLPPKFRPLPGRRNVVVTRQRNYALPTEVERFNDLDEALNAHATEDVWVIGGAEIYTAALPRANRLELTEVAQAPEGGVCFPTFHRTEWQETGREPHEGFSFVTYQRNSV